VSLSTKEQSKTYAYMNASWIISSRTLKMHHHWKFVQILYL